jgi:hypothetical protein
MTFDPSVYERSKTDYQKEPALPADQWIERFVAHMKELAKTAATPEFLAEMDEYARDVAPSYLAERTDYVDPEEAADIDVGYWENEE